VVPRTSPSRHTPDVGTILDSDIVIVDEQGTGPRNPRRGRHARPCRCRTPSTNPCASAGYSFKRTETRQASPPPTQPSPFL
jgi:hypothetical protein